MKKVLIIEDTLEVRMIIEETLEFFGFSTLSAEDGEHGIALAQQHLPDLIICDVNMPKLDGYGTLAKLRATDSTAMIPFIFLSGVVDRPYIRRGMEMGADDYLTKPFMPSELLAAVNARLEKKAEVKAEIQRESEKKLDDLRGKMTMALPHELRTPLNGIMGLASILMDDHDRLTPGEVHENARYIHESALRLHRLIENFLAYAQIELMSKDARNILDTATNSFTPVEPLTSDTARTVATRFQREADLRIAVMPATVAIIADNWHKIIEEVVDNACKFSAPGTPVKIIGGTEGHQFTLAITNEGRGMTSQQIASVAAHMQFEREQYEQQGAGLGLIIAKRLAELNGARLHIESVPGKETTVSISVAAPASRQK